MRIRWMILVALALLAGVPACAQSVPEIGFVSAAEPLKLPDNIYLGENVGIAANSKGDIFVLSRRTGHPYLTEGTSRPFTHGGTRLFRVRIMAAENSFARSGRIRTDS